MLCRMCASEVDRENRQSNKQRPPETHKSIVLALLEAMCESRNHWNRFALNLVRYRSTNSFCLRAPHRVCLCSLCFLFSCDFSGVCCFIRDLLFFRIVLFYQSLQDLVRLDGKRHRRWQQFVNSKKNGSCHDHKKTHTCQGEKFIGKKESNEANFRNWPSIFTWLRQRSNGDPRTTVYFGCGALR